jgi:hypothetical protein
MMSARTFLVVLLALSVLVVVWIASVREIGRRLEALENRAQIRRRAQRKALRRARRRVLVASRVQFADVSSRSA